jgi:hypothetical protein
VVVNAVNGGPPDASASSGSMKAAASTREKVIGALMIAAAIAYLIPFVPRGWIAHDEGMLGQSAERVLHGDLPHVDYQEMYTGGLSWLYGAVFRVAGIDLVNIRWVLFIGASLAIWLIYAITRRYFRPMGAALATWIALVWSFPNYFAGLPSWWLLICALFSLWALLRHSETGQTSYVFAAGLTAGLAITIKQTGVFLFIAVMLSLLYSDLSTCASVRRMIAERLARRGLAAASVTFAILILAPRVFASEGLYLLIPIIACATALSCAKQNKDVRDGRSPLKLAAVAALAAALPLAWLLIPYVTGGHFWQLVHGAILLPRKRLLLVSRPMADAVAAAVFSFPLLVLAFLAFRTRESKRSVVPTIVAWAAAVIMPIHALSNGLTYQTIWQFARTAAAFLPLVIAWQLVSNRVRDPRRRALLFTSAAMLAWASLNQFPYAGSAYLCYVAPLAVIAAVAAVGAEPGCRGSRLVPLALLLLMFAVLSANRSYPGWLGAWHVPVRFDEPLNLPKAHLNIGQQAQAYRQLLSAIGEHLKTGQLVAGPDCPEVYFLAGVANASGRLYDLFSNNENNDVAEWSKAEVVVVNHKPAFSAVLSEAVLATLRGEFAHGERLGQFEIRWR